LRGRPTNERPADFQRASGPLLGTIRRDAILPWLVDLFGGRQSARTVHFIAASLITLFVFVHVAMVLLAGPVNELRSMITGRFAIFVENDHE
jgi:thiosulfate reductase cytochrome b subunit